MAGLAALSVLFLLAAPAEPSGDPNKALKGVRIATLRVSFPHGDANAVSGQIAERLRANGFKCVSELSKAVPVLFVTVAINNDSDGVYELEGSMELQESGVVRGRKMVVTTWTTGVRGVYGPASDKDAVVKKQTAQLTDLFLSDWLLEN
jgi:hypothetical protein